jgi:hypothetical protein
MKIEEQTKVEIQQALGYAVPDPSAPGFAAFYSRLETEHPHLAAQLLAGLQHDEGEGETDSRALFPEQEAQARTRSQARNVLQRLFYRQDDLTDEWTVSKGKVGMAGLLGACLLMGPMLLAGAGGSGGAPAQSEPVAVVEQTAPAPAPETPLPPPVTEPPAELPIAEPPPAEAPLPPVAEAIPAPPPDTAALPPVAGPLPVAQPAMPAYDPAPMAVQEVQAEPPPPPPPIRPGATIFKAVRATADTSTTVYVSAARSGSADGAGKAGAPDEGGLTTYKPQEEVPPDVQFTVYASANPEVPATPAGSGTQAPGGQPPVNQLPGSQRNDPIIAGNQSPGRQNPLPAPPQRGTPIAGSPVRAADPAAPTAALPSKVNATYPVGTTLKAELATGVIVAEGSQSMPVLARTETGVVFSGLATLGVAGRLSIVFTNVLIGGKLESLSARAYDPGGLPGLAVRLREVAPSLAVDLTRAAAAGVAGYVTELGNQTETVIEGNTKTIIKIPPSLSNVIAGAVAKLFASPPAAKALERIGQVDRGTPMLITVMGEGAPVPMSKVPLDTP